jgi:hydrogenase maturation protease
MSCCSDEGFGVRDGGSGWRRRYVVPSGTVQVLDGGTLGMELLRFVTGTQRLLVLDSINGGQAPGTTFAFRDGEVAAHFQAKLSAHEVGIQDVLTLLAVTGRPIPKVTVIGAQPYELEAGVELSQGMEALLPRIEAMALAELADWGIEPQRREQAAADDFHAVDEAGAAGSGPQIA